MKIIRKFIKPSKAPLNGAGPGKGPSVKQQIIARNMRKAKEKKSA